MCGKVCGCIFGSNPIVFQCSSDVRSSVSNYVCMCVVTLCQFAYMHACVCARVLDGIIVCNSLLRPELPAADVSNNSECCQLTHTCTHKHTPQDAVSSCLKAVRSKREREMNERENKRKM